MWTDVDLKKEVKHRPSFHGFLMGKERRALGKKKGKGIDDLKINIFQNENCWYTKMAHKKKGRIG